MISFNNVDFKYKNGSNIFEDLNFTINQGEFISIIGKNGSGKSTLLNLMSGIIKPTKGNIIIDEINTKDKKQFLELRKKIGVVFQNPDNQILFPTVYEDIEFALNNLGLQDKENRIKEALEIVNMQDYIKNDSYELSLGQKQRLNIASVLAIKPKFIVLDEPTTMIDPIEKDNIYKALQVLKEQGYSIIFATNNIEEILLSDKTFIIENKKIKHVLEKKDIINNINILEESNIKIPNLINILIKLKEQGINVEIKNWSIDEIIEGIVKACKK